MGWSSAVHRSFVAVDVEGYGDPARTSAHRTAVRRGLYRVLPEAFAACDLPWDDKAVDDAGDAVMALLPADVPKDVLADRLPERIAAGLRGHNATHNAEARLRLRMAVHSGEVHYDERGKTGGEMIFTYRILDAAEAKRALRESNATLVLISSDPFYQSVIRQHPAARPEAFELVDVSVKEVQAKAWMRLVDDHGARAAKPAVPRASAWTTAVMGELVNALLRAPGFDTREGRDAVLRDLRFAGSVPRMATDRADAVSIVRTSRDYPDGLAELVAAVRFYAEGSTAMAEVDEFLARHGLG